MFFIIGHDTITDSANLQNVIMNTLRSEHAARTENGIPYTKECEILHYAINWHENPENPEYKYLSYINSNTKQLLDDYNVTYQQIGETDALPEKTVLLIRNSRFL